MNSGKKKECGQLLSENSMNVLESLMERERNKGFEPHHSFEGVMIRQITGHKLILLEIPEIMEYIRTVRTHNRPVISFFIVKTICNISEHFHENEDEMYVGGYGGTVFLDNPERSHIGRVMHPNFFTTVFIGGLHSMVMNSGVEEMSFFGIKF